MRDFLITYFSPLTLIPRHNSWILYLAVPNAYLLCFLYFKYAAMHTAAVPMVRIGPKNQPKYVGNGNPKIIVILLFIHPVSAQYVNVIDYLTDRRPHCPMSDSWGLLPGTSYFIFSSSAGLKSPSEREAGFPPGHIRWSANHR